MNCFSFFVIEYLQPYILSLFIHRKKVIKSSKTLIEIIKNKIRNLLHLLR